MLNSNGYPYRSNETQLLIILLDRTSTLDESQLSRVSKQKYRLADHWNSYLIHFMMIWKFFLAINWAIICSLSLIIDNDLWKIITGKTYWLGETKIPFSSIELQGCRWLLPAITVGKDQIWVSELLSVLYKIMMDEQPWGHYQNSVLTPVIPVNYGGATIN